VAGTAPAAPIGPFVVSAGPRRAGSRRWHHRSGAAARFRPAVATIDPRRHTGRTGRLRYAATDPQQQQRECVLTGRLAARTRAAPRDLDVIDGRLVRLGARTAA